MKMKYYGRVMVDEMAKRSGLHSNTIRNWTDRGIIECTRDFRGWRWFPDPDATLKRIGGLLDGTIQLEDQERRQKKGEEGAGL